MKALGILRTVRGCRDFGYFDGEKESINEAIKELEELENKDRLAELEKVILDYYLNKGYKVNVGGWGFKVNISKYQKQKEFQIMFRKNRKSNYETVFRIWQKTTKEMFDKAFEHFSIKEQEPNKEFKVFQGDRFSPPFVLKTFKTKDEAEAFAEAIQIMMKLLPFGLKKLMAKKKEIKAEPKDCSKCNESVII